MVSIQKNVVKETQEFKKPSPIVKSLPYLGKQSSGSHKPNAAQPRKTWGTKKRPSQPIIDDLDGLSLEESDSLSVSRSSQSSSTALARVPAGMGKSRAAFLGKDPRSDMATRAGQEMPLQGHGQTFSEALQKQTQSFGGVEGGAARVEQKGNLDEPSGFGEASRVCPPNWFLIDFQGLVRTKLGHVGTKAENDATQDHDLEEVKEVSANYFDEDKVCEGNSTCLNRFGPHYLNCNRRALLWDPKLSDSEPLQTSLSIQLERNFQKEQKTGKWLWHKSWNLPAIKVNFKIENVETPRAMPLRLPQNLRVKIYAVKHVRANDVKSDQKSMLDFTNQPYFEDVGLAGKTESTLLHGVSNFSSLKFTTTSFNHGNSSFHLLVVVFQLDVAKQKHVNEDSAAPNGLGCLNTNMKVIACKISPNIFVTSRKVNDHTPRKRAYFEPFNIIQLQTDLYLRSGKPIGEAASEPMQNSANCDESRMNDRSMTLSKEIKIEPDADGLINYFSAQNIRFKLCHPAFLAVKFHKCISIFCQTDLLTKKTQTEVILEMQKRLMKVNLVADSREGCADLDDSQRKPSQSFICVLQIEQASSNAIENKRTRKAKTASSKMKDAKRAQLQKIFDQKLAVMNNSVIRFIHDKSSLPSGYTHLEDLKQITEAVKQFKTMAVEKSKQLGPPLSCDQQPKLPSLDLSLGKRPRPVADTDSLDFNRGDTKRAKQEPVLHQPQRQEIPGQEHGMKIFGHAPPVSRAESFGAVVESSEHLNQARLQPKSSFFTHILPVANQERAPKNEAFKRLGTGQEIISRASSNFECPPQMPNSSNLVISGPPTEILSQDQRGAPADLANALRKGPSCSSKLVPSTLLQRRYQRDRSRSIVGSMIGLGAFEQRLPCAPESILTDNQPESPSVEADSNNMLNSSLLALRQPKRPGQDFEVPCSIDSLQCHNFQKFNMMRSQLKKQLDSQSNHGVKPLIDSILQMKGVLNRAESRGSSFFGPKGSLYKSSNTSIYEQTKMYPQSQQLQQEMHPPRNYSQFARASPPKSESSFRSKSIISSAVGAEHLEVPFPPKLN